MLLLHFSVTLLVFALALAAGVSQGVGDDQSDLVAPEACAENAELLKVRVYVCVCVCVCLCVCLCV